MTYNKIFCQPKMHGQTVEGKQTFVLPNELNIILKYFLLASLKSSQNAIRGMFLLLVKGDGGVVSNKYAHK